MAFRFNAKAWQGLKVFFDQNCRLLYHICAYTLIGKRNELFSLHFS